VRSTTSRPSASRSRLYAVPHPVDARPEQNYDAARLMLPPSPRDHALQNDQMVARAAHARRKLLDQGKFSRLRRDPPRPPPANEYYRADLHFMCGWIALRYLDDPVTAATHFRPNRRRRAIHRAGAGQLLRGRAAEALGETDAMRESYQAAAAIRPPITDSSRAPSLAMTRLNCARPRPLSRRRRSGHGRTRARRRYALRNRRARHCALFCHRSWRTKF